MAHLNDCKCSRCSARTTEKLPQLVAEPADDAAQGALVNLTEEVRRALDNLSAVALTRMEEMVKARLAELDAQAGVDVLRVNVERAHERLVVQLGKLETRVAELERYMGRGA